MEEIELTKEELQEMLTKKNSELAEVKEELASVKTRALKVFEQNNMLQNSPAYAEQAADMKFHLELAKQFTKSKAFPALTPEQIYTLMKAGSEMGMQPIESLNTLYIVKGKIEPYGKGMISILTKNGYRIKYTETPTECTVTVTGEDFEGSETVNTNDPIIKRSNAFKIAPRNKLRFHAIRMLLNFQLPHLISSTADLFESDALTAGKDEKGNTVIEVGEESVFKALKESETLEQLLEVENKFKAQITKNIVLVTELGKAKKRFEDEK